MKKYAGFGAAMLMAAMILLSGCAAGSHVFVNAVTVENEDVWSASYHKFNGSHQVEWQLEDGEQGFEIGIGTTAGELDLEIRKKDGEILYQGRALPTSMFTVDGNGAGTYVIRFTAKNHVGSFACTKIEQDIGASARFTQAEIKAARDCVKETAALWEGCELIEIRYDEAQFDEAVAKYKSIGRGAGNDVPAEDVLVLFVDFTVDYSNIDSVADAGVEERTDSMWFMIRDSGTGAWTVDDVGFSAKDTEK